MNVRDWQSRICGNRAPELSGVPDLIEAVEACIAAGAPGITVHPRADQRHITPADVRAIATQLHGRAAKVEYNIEGDPRQDFLDLVLEVKPDQYAVTIIAKSSIELSRIP